MHELDRHFSNDTGPLTDKSAANVSHFAVFMKSATFSMKRTSLNLLILFN